MLNNGFSYGDHGEAIDKAVTRIMVGDEAKEMRSRVKESRKYSS